MTKPIVFALGVLVGYFALPFLMEAPARFGGR